LRGSPIASDNSLSSVRRAFHTKSPLAGCSSITCATRSNAGSLDERRNQLGMRLRVAGTESSVYPGKWTAATNIAVLYRGRV